MCAFGTNEDLPDSPRSGTPGIPLDIKTVESRDGGRTWSPPILVYAGAHRNYLPSLVALSSNRLLVTFASDGGCRAIAGNLER